MINENSTTTIESAVDSTDVTAALNGILTTDKFAASPQMSAFLKYVVEQTLMGNTRRIKAFTVGIEALGKSASFDPQTDPSVRVLAKRLRSSLDTYYEKNPNTPIFIEMKPGSYIPKFILRSEMAPSIPQQVATGYAGVTTDLTPSTEESSQAPHIRVQQQQEREANSTGTDESRKANMNKLWQAYRSSSKVA